MNGNYFFVPQNAVPLPGQSMPLPTPFPPQYPVTQPMIDSHNYNVPPALPPANLPTDIGDNSHPNNGHQSASYPMPSHPPIILGQPLPHHEIVIPPGTDRVYYPQYNRLEEHRPNVPYHADICPPQFVHQNNMHMPAVYPVPEEYPSHSPIPREEIYNPMFGGEMVPEFCVSPPVTYANMPRVDRRADAVWAPNLNEIFNFGEMRGNNMPPVPHPEQAYTPHPAIAPAPSRHPSPVDFTGPRPSGPPAVKRPPAPADSKGPSPVPATANGSKPSGGRVAVTVTVTERLAAAAKAAKAYQVTGLDDQELEAGLQALERRIDTEFKIAD